MRWPWPLVHRGSRLCDRKWVFKGRKAAIMAVALCGLLIGLGIDDADDFTIFHKLQFYDAPKLSPHCRLNLEICISWFLVVLSDLIPGPHSPRCCLCTLWVSTSCNVANPIWPRPLGGKEQQPKLSACSINQKKFSLRGRGQKGLPLANLLLVCLVAATFFEAQPKKLDEARCQQRFILYAGKYLPRYDSGLSELH